MDESVQIGLARNPGKRHNTTKDASNREECCAERYCSLVKEKLTVWPRLADYSQLQQENSKERASRKYREYGNYWKL